MQLSMHSELCKWHWSYRYLYLVLNLIMDLLSVTFRCRTTKQVWWPFTPAQLRGWDNVEYNPLKKWSALMSINVTVANSRKILLQETMIKILLFTLAASRYISKVYLYFTKTVTNYICFSLVRQKTQNWKVLTWVVGSRLPSDVAVSKNMGWERMPAKLYSDLVC